MLSSGVPSAHVCLPLSRFRQFVPYYTTRTMKGKPIRLTTTSYALLALLDQLGEATSYDIKQALDQSIQNFWPVPHTTAYEEPARLAEGGYLSVEQEAGGRRRKSYALTERGRRRRCALGGRADRRAAAAARRSHAQGLRRRRPRARCCRPAPSGTAPSWRSSAAIWRKCAPPRAGRPPSGRCSPASPTTA